MPTDTQTSLELSIVDRAVIHNRVIQSRGSIQEAVTAHNLRAKLRPTDEERDEYGIDGEFDGNWGIDPKHPDPQRAKEERKEVEIEPRERDLLKACYEWLGQQKAFPQDNAFVDLFMRVMEPLGVEIPQDKAA